MSGAGITPFLEGSRRWMRIRNEYAREALAELLGTGIVTLFAVAGGIQHFANPSDDSMQPIFGSLFGLMAAILIVGGSSGGHVNPAVTLGLCIAGNCSWIKLPLFWVAQILGAYIGAGLALANYAWMPLKVGVSMNVFFPAAVVAPVPGTPIGSGFLDQIIGTSILVMLIIACCDKRNMQVPKALIGFFICLTICGLAMCFGINAGAVLNPARDFGARLMGLSVGFRSNQIMTVNGTHWWLVGFFGPLIGGALGSVLYVTLIGAHLNDEDEDSKVSKETNGEDWRSTRFMPKAQAPQSPNQYNVGPQQQQSPQQGQQPQNPHYGASNYGYSGPGGAQNAGYAREDIRNRQGY
ncbi:unnamed protein product [Allacma fusca]|uniref:Aquaporin n=1 Tax=Allacma fusca TaxID=39272 RepID=A0A8J2JKL5_9HEXA|nr:unnamed protein product [Allacma fusca]